MSKPIQLPPCHNWREVNLGASLIAFACDCGATFVQDLQDGSVTYEEGEGHDEDDKASEVRAVGPNWRNFGACRRTF
jgi:hypothetical protein